MTDWQTNLPPGCLPSDVSDKDRRREDDEDDGYWRTVWGCDMPEPEEGMTP